MLACVAPLKSSKLDFKSGAARLFECRLMLQNRAGLKARSSRRSLSATPFGARSDSDSGVRRLDGASGDNGAPPSFEPGLVGHTENLQQVCAQVTFVGSNATLSDPSFSALLSKREHCSHQLLETFDRMVGRKFGPQ